MSLRVLHVIDGSEVGGGQTSVRHLVAGFSGGDVTSDLACRGGGPLVPAVSALGAVVHEIPFDKSLRLGHAKRLAAVMRARSIKLLHSHGLTATYYCEVARTWFASRVPLVYHQHGFHHFNHGRLTRRGRIAAERWLAGRADAVIAVSRSDRDQLVDEHYARPERVHLVHYGLPVATETSATAALRRRLRIDDGVPVVGLIGRLHPQKGIDAYLRALPVVRDCRRDAIFVVAGVGPLEGELRSLAVSLGVDDRVRWLCDGTPGPVIVPMLSVGVLASRWEGLPLVLLELMQSGRPIVCTAVPGCLDAIGPDEAELVPPGDAEGLARGILRLLEDPEEAGRKGVAARQRFETSFALSVMTDRVRSIYREVLT